MILVIIKILNCFAHRDVSSQCLFTNGCVIRFKGNLNNILLKKIKLPSLMLRVTGEIICFAVVYSLSLRARTFVRRERVNVSRNNIAGYFHLCKLQTVSFSCLKYILKYVCSNGTFRKLKIVFCI